MHAFNISTRSFRRFATALVFGGALLIGATNCEEAAVSADEPSYFPLFSGATWQYYRAHYYTTDSSLMSADTIVQYADGDTLLDNKRYTKIVDNAGNISKLVRIEGSRYFGRNHELYTGFSDEYLFLDSDVPETQSWEHIKNDGVNITAYVVNRKNATQIFHGVTYHDVIEMKVNYYYIDNGARHYRFSTWHHYAKGVGEIYAYYPYPSLTFSNLNISLLPR